MGLDMYLTARICLYANLYEGDDLKIKALNEMFDIKPGHECGVSEVGFEVAYWRKANHIHKWFVDNCQDGVDECQETYVERDQLRDLLGLCDIVLNDRTRADELLPTESGFFFGSTEYDESYFGDILHTRERISEVLNDKVFDRADFYYHSSW